MEAWTSVGVVGALVAGLSGSWHCALMCGPLACVSGRSSARAAVAWHVGRVLAYGVLGGVWGATGSLALRAFAEQARPVLPWVMAFGLVATAVEVPKRLGPLPGLRQLTGWAARRSVGLPAQWRATALGASTPFLPCGLLYGISLAALASGSWASGAAVMGGFALGATPALTAAQLHLQVLGRAGRWGVWARRGLPLVAAAVLVWRALSLQTAGAATTACH